jgi:hypothetical protein
VDTLAGASVTKTATLLGVTRAVVSKVMLAYMTHGKETSAKREQWMKINTSSYVEKDSFKKSHNYCSTGDRTAELNIHLEDPASTKIVLRDVIFTNPTSTVWLQLPYH